MANALTTTQSLALLEQLRTKLAPDDLQLLRKIAALTKKGHCTVAEIDATCFAELSKDAKTKAFQRLRERLTDAGQVSLQLHVDAARKQGGLRKVRFVGEARLATAQLEDLAGVRRTGLIDNRAERLTDPLILVITVTQTELIGWRRAFGEPTQQIERDDLVFEQYGELAGRHLIHINCDMGGIAAALRTQTVIRAWNPELVVAVGMAFGIDAEKQKYSDVLVAASVQAYEHQRIGKLGNPEVRDAPIPVPSRALQRFKLLKDRLSPNKLRLHIGKLLSGAKLVDNLLYRDGLLKLTGGDAIGGEMEGFGFAPACEECRVHWLMIKGIADWADGNKPSGDEKIRCQIDAAFHAAIALRAAFDHDFAPTLCRQSDSVEDFANDRARPAIASAVPEQLALATMARMEDAKRLPHLIDNRAWRTDLAMDRVALAQEVTDATNKQAQAVSAFATLQSWVQDDNSKRYFALLGEYGMGKTVLCQRLTEDLEQRRKRGEDVLRPLYFDLRLLSGWQETEQRGGASITRDRDWNLVTVMGQCVEKGWALKSGQRAPSTEELLQMIEVGALLIFDGLDEALVHMTESAGLQFTAMLMRALQIGQDADDSLQNTSRSKLLVSCRTHYFKSMQDMRNELIERRRGSLRADSFETLLLLPFSAAQISECISHAFPNLDVDRTLETIRSVHNLEELASRPYLIQFMGDIAPKVERWKLQGKKVQGVTVYRELVREWLGRDQGKHQINADHKLLVARDLAAELWRRQSRVIDASALSSWYASWRRAQSDPQLRYEQLHTDKLDEDLRNSQFLVRLDSELTSENDSSPEHRNADASSKQSGFRFAHSSLLEYFLAEYLLQALRDNAPERWAMPLPSLETLDFFGQLLLEYQHETTVFTALDSWRAPYLAQTSELRFHYALRAYDQGWPIPNLQGIDLRGAELDHLEIGRKLTGDQIKLNLSGANFAGGNLQQTVFRGVRLTGANFSECDADLVEFHQCNLDHASFDRAQMPGAILRRCSQRETSFQGANVWRMTCGIGQSRQRDAERALMQFRPHDEIAIDCALSESNRFVVSMTNRQLVVRDAQSLEIVLSRAAPAGGFTCGCFVKGSETFLTGDSTGCLRIWNLSTGLCTSHWQAHDAQILSCCASPDGATVTSVGNDGRLVVWDVAMHTERYSEIVGCLHNCRFAFSPDGHFLVGGGLNQIGIWNVQNFSRIQEMHVVCTSDFWYGRRVRKLFDVDSSTRWVAIVNHDHELGVWDLQHSEFIAKHESLERIISITFLPESTRIMIVVDGDKKCLWDFCSPTVELLAGDFHWTVDFAIGQSVIASATPSKLVLWPRQHFPFNPVIAKDLESSRDAGLFHNRFFAEREFDLITKRPTQERRQISAWPYQLLRVDSHRVAIGSHEKIVVSDHLNRPAITFKCESRYLNDAQFSPDGNMLVAAGDRLELFDLGSGERLQIFGNAHYYLSVCFSWDSKQLLVATSDEIILFEVTEEKARLTFSTHLNTRFCCFANRDRWLVAAGEDGIVWFEQSSSAQVRRISALEINHCAFSQDCNQLLSASDRGVLELWDTATGTLLKTLGGSHLFPIKQCGWLPDGQTVVSVESDSTARLWDLATGENTTVFYANEDGCAVWDPRPVLPDEINPKRLHYADGEAWRWLAWQTRDASGHLDRVPLEAFDSIELAD